MSGPERNERLIATAAIGPPREQVGETLSIGVKDDASAVGRPVGVAIVRGIRRHASLVAGGDSVHPDIIRLIVALPGPNEHAAAVRRKYWAGDERLRLADDRSDRACAIYPVQLLTDARLLSASARRERNGQERQRCENEHREM